MIGGIILNFGCFATLVKAHCINRRINNMELVNGLLEGIIQYANLTNKNGEELRFDKYESSKLLNNKNNIPLKIVDALRRETLFQNTSVLPVYKIMVCICPHISGLDGQSSGCTP